MVVENGLLKVIEYIKPLIKPKVTKEVVDPITNVSRQETISNESDKLELTLLDPNDSNQVTLHYKRDYITKAAFEGSLSSNHSQEKSIDRADYRIKMP